MRHGKLVRTPTLGLADDFGTRRAAFALTQPELGTNDDWATRHASEAVELGNAR